MDAVSPVPGTTLRTIPQGDRLYSLILPLIVSMDTLLIALFVNADRNIALDSNREFAFVSEKSPALHFKIETRIPTLMALNGQHIPEIVFLNYAPRDNFPKKSSITDDKMEQIQKEKGRIEPHMRLLLEIGASTYLRLYESNYDWIRNNVSEDITNWSPILRFANIVRNAVAHYGHISWDSVHRPPVTWRGITYSHADNKREIIGPDIALDSLLILMFDFSDELDRLGCPHST